MQKSAYGVGRCCQWLARTKSSPDEGGLWRHFLFPQMATAMAVSDWH